VCRSVIDPWQDSHARDPAAESMEESVGIAGDLLALRWNVYLFKIPRNSNSRFLRWRYDRSTPL